MNRFTVLTTTGSTVYANVISHLDGKVYRTDTHVSETYVNANIASYAITMAETPAGSYRYAFTFPVLLTTAGDYTIQVYLQAGGGTAVDDTLKASMKMLWSGTAEIPQATLSSQIVALLTSTQYTVSNSVAVGEKLTIYQGDDFPVGSELQVSVDSYAGPDLTGGTSMLYIQNANYYKSGSTIYELGVAGTITIVGDLVTAKIILTSDMTEELAVKDYYYQVIGITVGDERTTLSLGNMEVIKNCGITGS
jgi:hypothetical protein